MRVLLTCTLVASALFAGCSDSGVADPAETVADLPIQLVYDLPAAIEVTQAVTRSVASPLIFVGSPLCSGPTVQCFGYTFTIANVTAYAVEDGNMTPLPADYNLTEANVTSAAPVTVAASLTWPGNSDFDLFLFDSAGTEVARSANDPTVAPVTDSEQFTVDVAAGDYTVVVLAWAVVQDTFTLNVTFPEA